MNSRRIVIGCIGAAAIAVALAVILGVVAWRRLAAPVPVLSMRELADATTIGFAELRLEPDDPWIQGLFKELESHSVGQRQDPSEILPARLAWMARTAAPGSEGHLLLAGLAPRGKFMGMVADFTLWKVGRAGGPKVARDVYRDEGITSFATGFPGHVFVRGNQFAWASDLETARFGIDRMIDPAPAPAPGTVAILQLLGEPQPGLLSGAILNGDGAIARTLSRLPGVALDIDPAEIAPATGLRFSFSALNADTGEGLVALEFPEGTPPGIVERSGEALASRLGAAAPPGVILEVARTATPTSAILSVRASGLGTLHTRFLNEGMRAIRKLEQESRNGEAAKDDQPSSTFQ